MKKLLLTMLMLAVFAGVKAQAFSDVSTSPDVQRQVLKAESAITGTFDPDPSIPLTEIPSQINLELSEEMIGYSPTCVVKSGGVEQTVTMNRGTDYQHFLIWASYYFNADIKAQIEATGQFTLSVTLNNGDILPDVTYTVKKAITGTFDPDPSIPLADIPVQINFELSEEMVGYSPTCKMTSGTAEWSPMVQRNGSYKKFVIWTNNKLPEDVKAQIEATGQFTLSVTLNNGDVLPDVTYTVKKAITGTFDPDPSTPLTEIPAQINLELSEVMNGYSPKCTVKSGDVEQIIEMRRNNDYQHFILWTYYFDDKIKAQIEATGQFTLSVTLNNGDVLPDVTYTMVQPITAIFDNPEGSIFAGLPGSIYFSLSKEISGESPKMYVNDVELACRRNGSYKDFYAFVSYYITGEALDKIKADGKFDAKIVLATGEEIEPVATFYLVDEGISWTAAEANQPGTVYNVLPKTLSFTLSEALPAEGKYTAGLMLADALGDEFKAWDVEVPCTIDGTAVTLDLGAISGEDSKRIMDNRDFTVGIAFANKQLTAAYAVEQRKQPVTLGYCEDEFSATDQFFGYNSAQSGIGAAICIPASKLEGMKGGTINKLRIGMGPGMQRVYAWIRPSLSKPAIFMKQIDTTIDGWQEVVLDEPYVITGEELYIGYSGYQPEGVKAIRVGGSDREGGCWLGARDVWEDCSKMGYGTLYIQAIGEAVLPGIDLGIGDATADKTLCKPSESVKVNFTIFNSGVETIDSYTLGYKVGDAEPVDSIIDTPIASDKRADHSLEIPMASVADGLQTVSVFCVINDEGKVDEVAGNDTIRFDVAVYSTDYPRTILIEHFTTAQCVNCPNGHRAAEKAVEGRDDYAWVAHHVGYGTDVFTIEQSKAFLDFDVLGAPSMMLDRTVVEGTTPPFTIGYSNAEAGGQLIAARLDKAKAIPAFARVAVSNEYNEDTRELTINIEGEKNAIFSDLYPECNYTVFLTEDNLVGFQTGAGPDYVHSHVLRSIETPTWGTPVQWDGNTFTATLTKELDAAWKAYDMKVIVALNKPFDAGNLANSQVLNAAVCKVDALNSIADAFVDSEIRVENGRVFSDTCTILGIYTPEGISVPNGSLSSGMYIISVADAAGMKHVIKTLIK